MFSRCDRTVRCLVLAGAVAPADGPALAMPSQEKPAANLHDLRDHFAACFRPPTEAAGTRLTFYFSLNNKGQVIAQPRTTWLGFKGSDDEKLRRLAGFSTAFTKCLPLPMSEQLAATIPGKVYFLQYIVADKGGGSQVLLRPFGSHYYGGGGEPALGFVPLLPRRRFGPFVPRTPVEPRRLPLVRPFRPFIGPLPQLLSRERAQTRWPMRPFSPGPRFR